LLREPIVLRGWSTKSAVIVNYLLYIAIVALRD